MERISIFGNKGQLRRDYAVKRLEKLLNDGAPEPTFSDEPTPQTNVFRRDGSLQRFYGRGDFGLMFGYQQEDRFTEDGSLNGKGGE